MDKNSNIKGVFRELHNPLERLTQDKFIFISKKLRQKKSLSEVDKPINFEIKKLQLESIYTSYK